MLCTQHLKAALVQRGPTALLPSRSRRLPGSTPVEPGHNVSSYILDLWSPVASIHSYETKPQEFVVREWQKRGTSPPASSSQSPGHYQTYPPQSGSYSHRAGSYQKYARRTWDSHGANLNQVRLARGSIPKLLNPTAAAPTRGASSPSPTSEILTPLEYSSLQRAAISRFAASRNTSP